MILMLSLCPLVLMSQTRAAAEEPEPQETKSNTAITEVEDNTIIVDSIGEGTVVDASTMDIAVANALQLSADRITIFLIEAGQSDSSAVNLPNASLEPVATANLKLELNTDLGIITLSSEAVQNIRNRTAETIKIGIMSRELNEATITLQVDGEDITDLNNSCHIELPVNGDVNVLVEYKPDGTERIIQKSYVENEIVSGLLTGSCTVRAENRTVPYPDVLDDAWFRELVDFVTSHNIFNGYSPEEFAPHGYMSRAMIATVFWRMEGSSQNYTDHYYTDIAPDAWYIQSVNWATDMGIMEGTGYGPFLPDENITREQLAVMLYRYAVIKGIPTWQRIDLTSYADNESISPWAQDAMSWAIGSGLMEPIGETYLWPQENITRQRVAGILKAITINEVNK